MKECKKLILSDLHRYAGATNRKAFFKHYLMKAGFHYSFYMRLCNYLQGRNRLLKLFARLRLQRLGYKYGIDIPYQVKIGTGFKIAHYGGIVIHDQVTIGNNLTLMQGVTIGRANRGSKQGVATIGDNVYIGAGAKIIGNVKIGNNVLIGANAVVTHDVPDNAVVGGIPAKIISYDGSDGYVNLTNY